MVFSCLLEVLMVVLVVPVLEVTVSFLADAAEVSATAVPKKMKSCFIVVRLIIACIACLIIPWKHRHAPNHIGCAIQE